MNLPSLPAGVFLHLGLPLLQQDLLPASTEMNSPFGGAGPSGSHRIRPKIPISHPVSRNERSDVAKYAFLAHTTRAEKLIEV